MIVEVTMYSVVCDICKKDALKDQEICAWNDKSMASEIAGNMDWFRDGDKHYCTDCHSFDDDDNLILKS
jgi:hypothetical protein